MWPRRKIQLAASSAAPGIEGVRALLNGMQLEFCEGDPSNNCWSEGFNNKWWEMPRESILTTEAELSPATEVVYWPGEYDQNLWCEKAPVLGLPQQSIQSFIHNILEDELVLRISEPTVLIEGRPLIGHVLSEAGFEPSILWLTADRQWQCEKSHGLYWLFPEAWLKELMEDKPLGRSSQWGGEKVSWVVRENQVDYYREQEYTKFIGHLPRWPEQEQEQQVYKNIAQCLELGVSWLDIMLALNPIWKQ